MRAFVLFLSLATMTGVLRGQAPSPEPPKRWPGTVPIADSPLLLELHQLYGTARDDEGLDRLDRLAADALEPAARLWFAALYQMDRGESAEAERLAQQLVAIDPAFLDGHRVLARLAWNRRDFELARTRYRRILDLWPDEAESYVDAITMLLLAGAPAEAREIERLAAARGVARGELAELGSLIDRAEHGPALAPTFEAKSARFVVTSDIDEATSRLALRELEDVHRRVRDDLWLTADRAPRPGRAFVFAERADYARYVRCALGTAPPSTSGIYSPILKQLVVRDDAELVSTLRHEGFHLVFDQHVANAPLWLDEGLALSYERNPTSNAGKPLLREDLLATLARAGDLESTASFVSWDVERFRRDELLVHYAQAWATVHLLRNTTPVRSHAFRHLVSLLRRGATARGAVARALRRVDLTEVDRDLAPLVARPR